MQWGRKQNKQRHCVALARQSACAAQTQLLQNVVLHLSESCLMAFIKCLSAVYALGLQEIKCLTVVSEGSKERVQELH